MVPYLTLGVKSDKEILQIVLTTIQSVHNMATIIQQFFYRITSAYPSRLVFRFHLWRRNIISLKIK